MSYCMETTLSIFRNGFLIRNETFKTLEGADDCASEIRENDRKTTRIDYTIEGERYGSWIKGIGGWRYYCGNIL